jgi:hypothetical protein
MDLKWNNMSGYAGVQVISLQDSNGWNYAVVRKTRTRWAYSVWEGSFGKGIGEFSKDRYVKTLEEAMELAQAGAVVQRMNHGA